MGSSPLAPLLKGYEERATEKDKLLQAYQEKIAQLKEEVNKLAEENERLLVCCGFSYLCCLVLGMTIITSKCLAG